MNKTIEALSKSVDSLDKNIAIKLDFVNKSNADLFVQFQGMSQSLTNDHAKKRYEIKVINPLLANGLPVFSVI